MFVGIDFFVLVFYSYKKHSTESAFLIRILLLFFSYLVKLVFNMSRVTWLDHKHGKIKDAALDGKHIVALAES